MVDVCAMYAFRGNTFVPCTLFTPPPTNPTRHDIIPLIYPLVPSSTGILAEWKAAAFQETIRKTTRIKLDIAVCDLVQIYAI